MTSALDEALESLRIQEIELMKYTNITTTLKRVSGLSLFAAGALFASQAALACQTSAWSVTDGAVAAGDPSADNIARYQGLCGLEVTGSGFVQDNSPGGIDRIVARFYVLNALDSGQSAVVYRGFSDTAGTGFLFTVRVGTNGSVTLIDNGTGETVVQSGSTKWLSVEIDWAQGNGNGVISLSVNGQSPDVKSLNNTGSALQAVQLGNLTGAAGTLGFDSYESRRSTAVGRLLRADANSDGLVDVGDVTVIANEVFASTLATGQPDCNEDGLVDVGDVTCASNVIFN